MGPGDAARRLLARSASTTQLGIDTLQLSVSWAAVAPTRPAAPPDPADPAYRWPADVDARRSPRRPARGIRLSLLVAQHAAVGQRRPLADLWRPTRAQDFADFLTAAARRYPAVRRWMIWGEPNRADRFQPNALKSPIGPRAYAALLDAAYAALKRASRHNIVIGAQHVDGRHRQAGRLPALDAPARAAARRGWTGSGHNPFPFRFPKLAEQPLAGGYRDISDVDTISARRAAHLRPPRPAVAVGVHDPVRPRLGGLRDVRLARRAGALPHRRLSHRRRARPGRRRPRLAHAARRAAGARRARTSAS